jgi:hypothetical protein
MRSRAKNRQSFFNYRCAPLNEAIVNINQNR